MKKLKMYLAGAAAVIILGVVLLTTVFTDEAFSAPKFYVANAGDGTISKVDFTMREQVQLIEKEFEQLSHGIAISPDEGTVYYGSGFEGKSLYAMDVETEKNIKELHFEDGIHGIDIHPDGEYLYVSLMAGLGEIGGVLAVIDTKKFEVVANITTEDGPAHVSVSSDGSQVWVTNVNANSVSVIDAYTFQVLATIPVGEVPNEVALSPNLDLAFSANVESNSLSIIDMKTFEVVDEIEVGKGVHGVTISPDGSEVWTANNHSNDVSVVDIETFSLITTIDTGTYANHIAFNPEGDLAFVTNRESNNLVIIGTEEKVVVKELDVGKEPHEMTLKGMRKEDNSIETNDLWKQMNQERYQMRANGNAENVTVDVEFLSPYDEKNRLLISDLVKENINPIDYFSFRIAMTTHSGDLNSIPFEERIVLENNQGDLLNAVDWIVVNNDSHHPEYIVLFERTVDGIPILTNELTQLSITFSPFITEELSLDLSQ